jgi:hypothetical protein
MGISVTQLRDQLKGGGARPSLFFAKILFSENLKTALGSTLKGIIDSDEGNGISFFMKGSQIPESTLNSVSMNFLGREFKIPSTDRVFQDWTVQVMNDEDYRIRHVFEAWIEHITPGGAIFDTQAAFGNESDNSVFCDMQVHQLRKDGYVSRFPSSSETSNALNFGSYYFKDAFPTSVSGIDLSWDTKDTIEEFTVQFAYQYWEKDPNPDIAVESPFGNSSSTQAVNWVRKANATT